MINVLSIPSVVALGVVAVGSDRASLYDPGDRAVPTPPAAALGHGYARHGDHIYFDGVRIDQADREAFKGFQRSLGRRLVLADDVDAASFVALSGGA